jgi:non-homologous end joining protein Ku
VREKTGPKPCPRADNVVNLMDALKNSIEL